MCKSWKILGRIMETDKKVNKAVGVELKSEIIMGHVKKNADSKQQYRPEIKNNCIWRVNSYHSPFWTK